MQGVYQNYCFIWVLLYGSLFLSVFFEIIENRLPTAPLHLDRILIFGIKRDFYMRTVAEILKGNDRLSFVVAVHRVGNFFIRNDFRVGTGEIKTGATILRLHPSQKS